MDQDQFVFTFTKILKRRPTLENIPEDVAEVIADIIKSWATIEGDLKQREKQRRLRDHTLRAVALSCRKAYSFYRPLLLESVTLDFRHLFSFYQALQRNQDHSHLIKSLTFNHIADMSEDDQDIILSQIISLLEGRSLEDSEGQAPYQAAMLEFQTVIFHRLVSLQSLLILDGLFIPRSLKQLSCLLSSLKRLYVPLWDSSSSDEDAPPPLNAKNVIWLLSFGSLEHACLGFTTSTSDFEYLSEHHQAFERTSKIKKLSLYFSFVYRESDRRTWWGTSRERNMVFEGGNMKTEALSLLLQVVNGLECLEIYYIPAEGAPNGGDETMLNLRYIFGLKSLFGKLLHLRLFASDYQSATIASSVYPCLKTLTVDVSFVTDLVNLSNSQLPSRLERLVLPYYLASTKGSVNFREEHYLAQVVRDQVLPHLKEVVVPLAPIGVDGKALDSAERSKELEIWTDRREKLESEQVFKSGKVELRKVGPGLKITSVDETFMSHLLWLSPP